MHRAIYTHHASGWWLSSNREATQEPPVYHRLMAQLTVAPTDITTSITVDGHLTVVVPISQVNLSILKKIVMFIGE